MTLTAAVIVLQFAVLVLPRDPAFMPLIYGSPWLACLALLAFGGFNVSMRAFACVLAIACSSAIVGVATESSWLNVLLSVATYSSVALLLLHQPRAYRADAIRLFTICLTGVGVILVVFGVAQFAAHGFPLRLPYRDFSPDAFAGPYGDGGPRIVTMMMVPAWFWALASTLHEPRPRTARIVLLALLTFGVVAPGSNATILAGLLALVGWVGVRWGARLDRWLRRKRRPQQRWQVRRVALLALVATGTFAAAFALTGSAAHVERALSRFGAGYEDARTSPKLVAARDTLWELPRAVPTQPLVGVGLGNYSSWSQLLLSGVYVDRFLSGRVQDLPVRVRDEAWDHVLVHLSPAYRERFGRFYVESVATQPWFSWQSLYAEIGLVGLLLVAVALVPKLAALRSRPEDPRQLRAFKSTMTLYALFAFAMGFVDNYFEYPWLLVPFLLGLALLPRGGSASRSLPS